MEARLQHGGAHDGHERYNKDNLQAWDAMSEEWETFQSPATAGGRPDDGNDMFTQCLLPEIVALADWKQGETVLDLGAGSGIIARRFAAMGAHVTGLDFSEKMLQKGRERSAREELRGSIEYDFIDLMDYDGMAKHMAKRNQ